MAITTDAMPLGNATGMMPEERAILGRWIAGGASRRRKIRESFAWLTECRHCEPRAKQSRGAHRLLDCFGAKLLAMTAFL